LLSSVNNLLCRGRVLEVESYLDRSLRNLCVLCVNYDLTKRYA
jgi:hypothetical protein